MEPEETRFGRFFVLLVCALTGVLLAGCPNGFQFGDEGANDTAGADGRTPTGDCEGKRTAFVEEAWAPVIENNCIGCHHDQGLAADRGARLVFEMPTDPDHVDANIEMLERVVLRQFDDPMRLVRKPTTGPDGETHHGGGKLFDWNSPEAESLRNYVDELGDRNSCPDPPPVFRDVTLLEGPAHLQKATRALANRNPTADELKKLRDDPDTFASILSDVMTEEAFFDRVREFFNLKLTRNRFCPNGAKKQRKLYGREQACWWASDAKPEDRDCKPGRDDPDDWIRKARAASRAICRESVNKIAHIVKEERSFKEILTANWTLVNPYSARTYGVFDELTFDDPKDPEAYRRVKLPHPKADHRVPHAGIVTDFTMMGTVGTNRGNKHRHRSWWFYKFFLGTDILEIAPENVNPLADGGKHPLKQNPSCAACHHVLDPAAGMFTHWSRKHGHYRTNRRGWEKDYWGKKTWARGFGAKSLRDSPEASKRGYDASLERGLQWLAERAADDPRFAQQTARFAYELVTGEEPMELPVETESPGYRDRVRVYLAQQALLDRATRTLRNHDYDFKVAVAEIVRSKFFRAARLEPSVETPSAAHAELGTSELLTPQDLHRQLQSLLGVHWGKRATGGSYLLGKYRIAFGGVESLGSRRPMESPNAAWAGGVKRLAHEVGCLAAASDFERPLPERLLFPHVEPSTRPDGGKEAIRNIRKNIEYLYRHLLQERVELRGPAVDNAYELFRKVWSHGVSKLNAGDKPETLISRCRGDNLEEDPNYTIRAWQTVLTFLMTDSSFWYD